MYSFFFSFFIMMYLFLLSSFFFIFFFIISLQPRFFFFFGWLENVENPNNNKSKLLIFTQKIEELLSLKKRSQFLFFSWVREVVFVNFFYFGSWVLLGRWNYKPKPSQCNQWPTLYFGPHFKGWLFPVPWWKLGKLLYFWYMKINKISILSVKKN